MGKVRKTTFYPMLYRSYWHSILANGKFAEQPNEVYYTAVPNPGAGIGHQMANWIAGYAFARRFQIQFAHSPFTSEKWEKLLGFGEGEALSEDLLRKKGYKRVVLPLFDEENEVETALNQKICNSYRGTKTLLVAELDQFYRDQSDLVEDLNRKFHEASSRKFDQLKFSPDSYNIAIHIRRGDVFSGYQSDEGGVDMRYQDSNYFERVLEGALRTLGPDRAISIYLFSQGETEEFRNFAKYPNLELCLKMSAQDTFLHMAFADLLITSKSSFSYKPGLLSNGIKLSPKNFWHGYPDSPYWILVEDDGSFDEALLTAAALSLHPS